MTSSGTPTDVMDSVTTDVIAIIAKRLETWLAKSISLTDRLEDFVADSINAMEVIFDLEEKYDIGIEYNANQRDRL